jgi:hypothetical protein
VLLEEGWIEFEAEDWKEAISPETEERVDVTGNCEAEDTDIVSESESVTDVEEAIDVGCTDEEAILRGDGRTDVD